MWTYLMTKIRIIHSVGMRNQVNKHHLLHLDTFLWVTRKPGGKLGPGITRWKYKLIKSNRHFPSQLVLSTFDG